MAQTRIRIGPQLQQSTTPGSILASNTSDEAQWVAPSTGADHLWFYDHSATALVPLTVGTNLSISGTTLNASAGAGGYATIQEEGSDLTQRTTLNFVGSGITAADDTTRTTVTLNTFLNTLATQGDVDLTADVTGLLPFANIANGNALSVLGRSANSSGVMASIAAGTDHQVLRRSGTSLAFGAINLAQSAAVTGVLDETNGGTGQSTITTGDILYGSSSNTLSKLPIGASTTYLKGGTTPSWATLNVAALSDGSNVALLDGNQTFTGNNVFDENITMNGTPSADAHVITVGYLNTVLANQAKTSVRVATTAAGTLATSFENGDTVDSITLVTGDRILIKDQAAPAENGIYVVQASGAPVRADDMNAAAEVDGTFVIVEDGTTNQGTFWYTISEVTTLNTDSIVWIRVDKATDITAGTGLSFTGLTLNVGTASTARIVVNANDIDLATTAVTPASYGSATQVGTFTVDTYGRLTAASNTTIAIDSTAITDFQETVQDIVGGLVSDTDGVTWTYNGGSNILEVDVNTLYTADGTIAAGVTREVTLGDGASELDFIDDGGILLISLTDESVEFMDGIVEIATTSINVNGDAFLEAGTNFGLVLSNAATAIITDSRATTIGLQYNADYSADYTDRTLPDWEAVQTAIAAVTPTIQRGYATGISGTTIDLDANDGSLTDIADANVVITVPADPNKIKVYRNGIMQSQDSTGVTRDYDFTGNNLIFTTALTSADTVVVEKIS
jgi:hypothetical protein